MIARSEDIVRCRLCKQHKLLDEMHSFQIKDRQLQVIDLAGEYPWTGIYLVCFNCCQAIGEIE